MEGAVLSGKLCAKEINEYSRELKSKGVETQANTAKAESKVDELSSV
jgi:hypothetical protein